LAERERSYKTRKSAEFCGSQHRRNASFESGIYVNDNFQALDAAGVLTGEGLIRLTRSSFEGSFLSQVQRERHLAAKDMIAREF
jgi:adenosine deaminase